MPTPVVVPVVFDEDYITQDLARLPASAGLALRQLRDDIATRGGLPATRLRRCDVQARDGTSLPNCVKTYVPWGQDKWGLVFTAVQAPGVAFAIAAIAYGVRHPTGMTTSVYEIAHRRLHPR